MRRLMLVVAVVALTGCSKDLFKAHADEAASAGSLTLSPERLAEILNGPKGVRLNSEAAGFVTGLWLDYALFAEAVADHKLPDDSLAVAKALWPAIAGIKAERWHDSVVARRLNLTDAGLDSIFTSGPLRMFQHMLFTVSQTATPEEHAAARKKAEDALAQVKRGANFGTLALKLSQDPGSAADSGYLPPRPKGGFITAFDSAGWTLKPGEVSGVVQTPYGYHVIRRPTLEDARSRFRASAEQVVVARVDSVYFDSLAQRWNLKVDANAPKKMRDALDDKEGSRGSKDRLASWSGGSLTVGKLLEWIGQLPPGSDIQIAQMPDSQLTHYARVVSQNEMLLQEADSAHVGPTPVEWAGLEQQYRAQVDSLKSEMGLGGDVADSSVAGEQRNQIAALKLKTYFDEIITGKVRARRLPASLGEVLRDRIDHRINQSGIQRGLELAQRQKAQQTSTDSAQDAGMQRPGLRPAPGPAPTPAASGDSR
jgi:hypothetical protein